MNQRRFFKLLAMFLPLLFLGHVAVAQTVRVYHLSRSSGGVYVAASSGKVLISSLGQLRGGSIAMRLAGKVQGQADVPSILASVRQGAESPMAPMALNQSLAQASEAELAQAVEEDPLPTEFALRSNYPNPFNPRTTIAFDLPSRAEVKLVIYDVLGRQVRVLVDGTRAAGTHEVVFEASDLPSGTYLVRLETPQGSFVQTMQLVK